MTQKESVKRPKDFADGSNDFAYPPGGSAPATESMTELLRKYIPHDQEAFNRLTEPSLKQKAQALDVAKVAMAGLDQMIAFLQQKRKTCGDQILADSKEITWLDKEIAKKQVIRKQRAMCSFPLQRKRRYG